MESLQSRRGRQGERLCAAFLVKKGWKILEERIKSPYGEVDIICERQGCLWAVEVKSRWQFDKDWIPGVISRRQVMRVRNALLWYAKDCVQRNYHRINLYLAIVDLSNRKIQFYQLPPKGW